MGEQKQPRIKSIKSFSAVLLSAVLLFNVVAPLVHAAAPVATEYSTGITASSTPLDIVAGPDGNLWFTEVSGNKIGKVTPDGVITEYSTGITASAQPYHICAGPDGALWFTENAVNKIGRITTSGVVTEFTMPAGGGPYGITSGSDGNLWFARPNSNRVSKMTTSGTVTEYSLSASSSPRDIVSGPDGNLWVTLAGTAKVAKVTTAGVPTEYSTGITPGADPTNITVGPDGNLWYTEFGGARVVKLTTAGVSTEYSTGITSGAQVVDIALGADGNLWITETNQGIIDKVTTAGVITHYSSGITGVSPGPYGITPGPDGNLWFVEINAAKIGVLSLIPSSTDSNGNKTSTVSSEYTLSSLNYSVVNKQTLVLDGAVCNVTVASGGTLQGSGHACMITVQSGGTISPGHSPGCLSSGNLSLSGVYTAQLASTTACSGYDQLQVVGTVTVGGALNVSLLDGFAPATGNTFTIISNDGTDPVSGTFSGLAEGSTITLATTSFKISYVGGDGNDVTITATALPGLPSTGGNPNKSLPLSAILALTGFTVLAGSLWTLRRSYARK